MIDKYIGTFKKLHHINLEAINYMNVKTVLSTYCAQLLYVLVVSF